MGAFTENHEREVDVKGVVANSEDAAIEKAKQILTLGNEIETADVIYREDGYVNGNTFYVVLVEGEGLPIDSL